MIHDSILSTIGRTPIVRIRRLAPEGIELYVKVESFNPSASVKDRLALAILADAQQRGLLQPGQTVVEATSGNTGVSLAMACASLGHPFVAFMADSFSVERRKLIRALGGRVVLTRAQERGSGMVRAAQAFAQATGAFLADQFESEANVRYHAATTGPEILQDFAARRLDWFVSGYGTGGTITGAGRVLKAARPGLRVCAAEPAGAALLSGAPWAPHRLQGWTPDFIAPVMDRTVHDRIECVNDIVARDAARALARSEGIFCGLSSGATFAAALQLARDLPRGSVLLAMLPDTGERYLSTFLLEDDDGNDVYADDADGVARLLAA